MILSKINGKKKYFLKLQKAIDFWRNNFHFNRQKRDNLKYICYYYYYYHYYYYYYYYYYYFISSSSNYNNYNSSIAVVVQENSDDILET